MPKVNRTCVIIKSLSWRKQIMISNQIIYNSIQEIKEISKLDMLVADSFGQVIAKTDKITSPDKKTLLSFIESEADSQEISGQIYLRIPDESGASYCLVTNESEDAHLVAKLAAAQLKNLIIAYKDRVDRNSFFQNLLLDNLLLVDIYNRALKLHIEAVKKRCVFVIEPVSGKEANLIDIVREMFYTEAGDFITAVDENHVVIIKALDDNANNEDLEEIAKMLVDMSGSEAMIDVRVAYGSIVEEIKGVSKSYKEAKMAIDVGKIFYPSKRTIAYTTLGIGRLIYQLPVNLCSLFVKEIFGEEIPEEIDDEILATVNKFFENSLNVSETSRQLFIHRNTLIYRIEKLQKATGLDVRVFDDALTLKIALMVVNYMKYIEEEKMQ